MGRGEGDQQHLRKLPVPLMLAFGGDRWAHSADRDLPARRRAAPDAGAAACFGLLPKEFLFGYCKKRVSFSWIFSEAVGRTEVLACTAAGARPEGGCSRHSRGAARGAAHPVHLAGPAL